MRGKKRQNEDRPKQSKSCSDEPSRQHRADLVNDFLARRNSSGPAISPGSQQIEYVASLIYIVDRRPAIEKSLDPSAPLRCDVTALGRLSDAVPPKQGHAIAPSEQRSGTLSFAGK